MTISWKRGLAAAGAVLGAVALWVPAGSGAHASGGSATVMGPGNRVDVRLSATETGNAADSFEAAKRICAQEIIPDASWFHSAEELAYPACPVAVQVCAMQALAQGQTAAITIYDTYFDCPQ